MPVTIDTNSRPPEPPLSPPSIPPKSDPTIRTIARDWRRLTNERQRRRPDHQRRTILAVSGGADSLAMMLAMKATAGDDTGVGEVEQAGEATGRVGQVWGTVGQVGGGGGVVGIAHVVHDLRPADETRADCAAVAALAAAIDLPFFETAITTDPADNPERAARDARYRALADIAARADCPFVATAHHADDQLESIIMALIRGAGPDGLRGIAPARPLTNSVTLIRPCLNITRAQTQALCQRAGLTWREDHTNTDTTRLRAALRHGPLAQLADIRPHAAAHASRAAAMLRDAAGLIQDTTRSIFADATTWPRATLRPQREIILGAGLRAAALRLTHGQHADALTAATVDPVIRAIRDDSTDPRAFDWPGRLTISVTAHEVSISRTPTP